MEKSKGLCRQIVLPTALDALILQRLSDQFFSAIRGKTPSKFAYFEPDTFTFDVSGRRSKGYGSLAAWLHFQKRLGEICNSSRYVVVSDVANYYDHIGHSSLRNIVSSSIEVEEAVFDLLLNILSLMNWNPDYLPINQTGLPQIDLDAPRVLAHSFLFDLDRYAERVAPGLFTRYMDDINFGAQDIQSAKKIVRDVDLVLHARQVRLNSGKTYILSAAEAKKFFRFTEHQRLDSIQKILELVPRGSAPYITASESLAKSVKQGYWKGRYDSGHGDKVLKRELSLCRIAGINIPNRIISDILLRRPTCRDATLGYLMSRPAYLSNVTKISQFIRSPEIIDDVGPLTAATTLVQMKFKDSRALQSQIMPVIGYLQDGGPHRLYAALWLLSKFGAEHEILDALNRSAPVWASNYELGRLAGGLFPRFYGTPQFDAYKALVQSVSTQSASSAYQFYFQLVNQSTLAASLLRFLLAKNNSLPNQITHQKYLMTLAVLKSQRTTQEVKQRLVATHVAAWSDHFYMRQVVQGVPKSMLATLDWTSSH